MSDFEHIFQKCLSDYGIAANYEGDGQYGGRTRRLRKFFDAGVDAGWNLAQEDNAPFRSEVSRLEEENTRLQSEVERLTQHIQQAEHNCQERIKADRLYCMKHGDKAAQEMAERLEKAEDLVERLRGRCGELESELSDCLKLMEESERRYEICQEPPNMNDQIDAVKELLSRDSGSTFWLLNRQAEALEAEADEWNDCELTYSGRRVQRELLDSAQRLRQQADEAEKAGGGE